VGGVARYENDYYFQISPDIANVPGNPWFVATLWLAEHAIAISDKPEDLARPRALLDWCATRALRSGVLSEQVHPYTGEPLSVSPLTWSHAAFVSAVQHYARKSQSIKERLRTQVRTAGEVIVWAAGRLCPPSPGLLSSRRPRSSSAPTRRRCHRPQRRASASRRTSCLRIQRACWHST